MQVQIVAEVLGVRPERVKLDFGGYGADAD